jgi:hypothetical protein
MSSALLKAIARDLSVYIVSTQSKGASTEDIVVLDNIAASKFAGGDNETIANKVVVSLVNVSEEGALKNNLNLKTVPGNPNQRLESHPLVHVNLYLLFTANFSDYSTAIDHLFRVLEFFQGRKVFNATNTPSTTNGNSVDYELTMDLHTLSFEQLNDLWGSLGGKQMPFVLYRARLIPVEMTRPIGRQGVITEIEVDTIAEEAD